MTALFYAKLPFTFLDDAKIARLPGELYKHFIQILIIAKSENNAGTLPTDAECVWRLRMDTAEFDGYMTELAAVGLIERIDGRWFMPGYEETQGASPAAERMRQMRSRQKKEKKKKEEDNIISNKSYDTSVTHVTKRNASGSGGAYWAIPEPLKVSEEFVQAWADWLRHVDESGLNFTETAAAMTLAELADSGVSTAVYSIKLSIKRGWKGVYIHEPRQPSKNGNGHDAPVTEVPEVTAAMISGIM